MNAATRIAAAVLVLLAAVLGFLAYRLAVRPVPSPAVPVARPESAPSPPSYPIVIASRAIPAGEQITGDALRVERWPVRLSDTYAAPDTLVGNYSRLDIAAGQPVTDALLAKGLARYLQPGERAVTIPVDDISGVQNRILPGDVVDLFFVLERGLEVPGTQTRLLQSRVRVLAFGGKSVDGPAPAEERASAASRNPPAAPRNAVLAVPVEKVNELLLATKSGRLQMALRAPQDEAVPDPGLFPERQPVLAARPGLTAGQLAQVKDPVNMAYAGEILPQLAGQPPAPGARAATRAPGHASGRTVEVVRGTSVQTLRY